MKPTFILIMVLGVTLASCGKKDYTCKCDGGLTGQGMQTEIKNAKKSAAKKACSSYEGPVAVDGFTNCRLL